MIPDTVGYNVYIYNYDQKDRYFKHVNFIFYILLFYDIIALSSRILK